MTKIIKKMEYKQYEIEELPSKIYKYYSFNQDLNKKRVTGYIYLASPLDFNDPYDCQLTVLNNVKDKEDLWIKRKLEELDIKENLDSIIENLRNDIPYTKEMVRRKQLEKLGIFCITPICNNIQMWGYYTNNEGICIEYDRELLLKRLLMGFVNNMPHDLTSVLFTEKKYNLRVEIRNNKHPQQRLDNAKKMFTSDDCKYLSNAFLKAKGSEEIINFIRNVYVKRYGSGSVKYVDKLTDFDVLPQLFYSNGSNITTKYYTKLKSWSLESEYRLVISLGGRNIINVGKDCIKSIRLGCNMSVVQVFELVSILYEANMNNVKLIQMKCGDSGLKEQILNLDEIFNQYSKFKELINER